MLKQANIGQAQWHSTVILAILEVQVGRIIVQGQPGQKFSRPHLNPKSWAWGFMLVIKKRQ
jgi:hypothetical protein